MISISLCMIVRNEEEGLERCLSSVKDVVDEYIIVDTGSTDRTKEIISKFTDKMYDFTWIDDFSAARNYSFSKATKDYILWLDADDIVDEANVQRMKQLKHTLSPKIDRVTMQYDLSFDASGQATYSLRRNRLVRRACNFEWIGPVHEYLAAHGSVFNSEVAIGHFKNKPYTDRNLQIYLSRVNKGEEFTPRDLYYFANELRDNARYEEAVDYYTRFLNTGQGWVEDNIQACLKMGHCHRLLGDTKAAVAALCQSIWYSAPTAQFCCDLGDIFLEMGRYNDGVTWFEQALRSDKGTDSMTLVNQTVSTWYPHLQICICYDKLGKHELASEHNEKALAYNPEHSSMLYNRKYFRNLLGARFVRGEGTPELQIEE
ncbi:glycosyltransferase [Paenibacillus albidus]|uniref:glycosyltransferase n=1 Tax=Paenibacillus albidus TaxID=2041023 RepID=UPI001BE5F387|nr:glycosyltransferase [Paenibacillus albidus]MBT2287720.1 glycosyltransferase [Paenibacillus albidus]